MERERLTKGAAKFLERRGATVLENDYRGWIISKGENGIEFDFLVEVDAFGDDPTETKELRERFENDAFDWIAENDLASNGVDLSFGSIEVRIAENDMGFIRYSGRAF